MTREEKNKVRHIVVQLEVALQNGYDTEHIHKELDELLGEHLKVKEK
jgi:hypothetical protein